MRNVWIAIFLLACVPFCLCAQRTKTIELKPVHKQGFNYYYDMKKVKSPYALQIPLLSLEDEEISRRYKNFNRLSAVGDYLYLLPTVYILSAATNYGTVYNGDALLWLFIATFGLDLTFDLLAHGQLKKESTGIISLLLFHRQVDPGFL